MLQRVKEVQESDLRMVGALARNIQRVLAVTQADIDAAAAQGQSWFVKPVVKVADPLDNLRGGTQLVIKQNSITPGQNVMRVIYMGGTATVVGPGTSPLSLPDATNNSLLSLIAYGGTDVSATPTPTTPTDIVCNNGAIKARHESGLPLGYTLLDYIESDGTQYIDTGFTPNQDTSAMLDAQFLNYDSGTQGILFGARTSSTENIFNIQRLTAGNWNMGYNNSNFNVGTADTNRHVFYKNKQYQYLDGVLKGTGTYSAFTCPGTAVLFGTNNSGTKYATAFPAKVWSFKMWDNGTLIRNLVPAQYGSNVGMYDLVNGVFYQNAGTGDFTAGDPVSDPVEIYTDGTVETIAIKDDQNATVSTATCEDLLSIGTYTDEQEVISGSVTRNVGVKVLDGTESWSRASNQDGSANYVFYTQLNDKKIGNNQPMLCTHYVYMGSASYVTLTTGKFLSNSANTSVYFDGGSITTVTNWKNWLATQYANGTPVIVIYPLATETTETVTPQPMGTAAGDNTAEITQAGMAGLELQVTYMKQGS